MSKKDKQEYDTFNGLAPEFQLGPEHDPDYIFPREYELIKEVRAKTDRVKEWPDRWILIFLFARKHDVDRTVQLLHEHIDYMVNELNVPEVKGGKNPVAWSRIDTQLLLEPHTMWKPGLVDKHGRLALIRVSRNYFPNPHRYTDHLISMAFWWYDSFDHLPLSVHRNGMIMIVDMGGTTTKNFDFSSESSKFQQNQLIKFPGRFRAGYVINSTFLMKAVFSFMSAIYKAKVMNRVKMVHKADLLDILEPHNLPEEYGGTWKYDARKDWLEPYLERYRPKGPANAWK